MKLRSYKLFLCCFTLSLSRFWFLGPNGYSTCCWKSMVTITSLGSFRVMLYNIYSCLIKLSSQNNYITISWQETNKDKHYFVRVRIRQYLWSCVNTIAWIVCVSHHECVCVMRCGPGWNSLNTCSGEASNGFLSNVDVLFWVDIVLTSCFFFGVSILHCITDD